MASHVVCRADELLPGRSKLVEIGKVSIGVYNIDGTFYAVRNRCPHRGAPLCRGDVGGTMLPSAPGDYRYGEESYIVRCPWHRWEFDLRNGESVLRPDGPGVKTYPVHIDDDVVTVEL